MKKILPRVCPACEQPLRVKRLECSGCGTAVEGDFELPLLARLCPGDQQFILNLLLASGSLKELSSQYGVSYPTMRNRLDSLITEVQRLSTANLSSLEGQDA